MQFNPRRMVVGGGQSDEDRAREEEALEQLKASLKDKLGQQPRYGISCFALRKMFYEQFFILFFCDYL